MCQSLASWRVCASFDWNSVFFRLWEALPVDTVHEWMKSHQRKYDWACRREVSRGRSVGAAAGNERGIISGTVGDTPATLTVLFNVAVKGLVEPKARHTIDSADWSF